MERMTASLSPCLASFGRCSLKRTPGAFVAISLNGPPLACPGLRSKVSIWLGPPFIHKRMHARLRCGSFAAASAMRSSQPDIEKPTHPAAVSRSRSRRDRAFADRLVVISDISRFRRAGVSPFFSPLVGARSPDRAPPLTEGLLLFRETFGQPEGHG